MSSTRPRIGELIGRVYDAAQDESLWPSVVSGIADAFSATSAVVSSGYPRILAGTENWDAQTLDNYAKYYYRNDPWLAPSLKLGVGKVFTSADLVPDSEFERTEFYNDFLRPHSNGFYIIGCLFHVAPGQMGMASVHRPHARGDYEEAERQRGIEFIPHLIRAIQVRHKLTETDIQRQIGLDGLERSQIAAIVVTGNGIILHANDQAERMLRAGDAIRSISGQLAAATKSATERLTMLIRGAIDTAAGRNGSAGGSVAIPRPNRPPLTILVAPFRPVQRGAGAPVPAALLFLRDPEWPSGLAAEPLRELFGLTAAEATIVSHLIRGRSLAEIATRHNLSLNTVRTHLKNIFAKTGTNRQTELVAFIARTVATMKVH